MVICVIHVIFVIKNRFIINNFLFAMMLLIYCFMLSMIFIRKNGIACVNFHLNMKSKFPFTS